MNNGVVRSHFDHDVASSLLLPDSTQSCIQPLLNALVTSFFVVSAMPTLGLADFVEMIKVK